MTHPTLSPTIDALHEVVNLDGVYVLDAYGEPAFFELPQPFLGELNALVGWVAVRVVELLRKRGLWLDSEKIDAMAEENPMLSHLAQASMRGTLAFGNFTRPVRLQARAAAR